MKYIPGANQRVYAMRWYKPSLWLSDHSRWWNKHVHRPLFVYFYEHE